MQNFILSMDENTRVLLVLSVILFAGFILTRLTNTLNLPKVSGYILAGIVIGPYCMNLIPGGFISHMGFISDLALAFIAFDVGKFFKREVISEAGPSVILITLFETLLAGFLVTVSVQYVFHVGWPFALVMGAIATATAPASTMMTINQYHARGVFVDTLLQVVALDNVVCLLTFSIVSAIANSDNNGTLVPSDILLPLGFNLLAMILGLFCGYFLSRLLIPTRSKDNRLILAIALLLGLTGLCAAMDISPLLSCMVFGAAYINFTEDKKLFRQINNFTPPVMSIFFILSGMNLDVSALSTIGAIGVLYFLVRIIGKYLGTFFAGTLLKSDPKTRNYLGLALIPQAGVAIGLAFLGQRILPPTMGNMLLTIILASSVLYEMIGPVSAKIALIRSGSIDPAMLADPGYEQEPEESSSLPAPSPAFASDNDAAVTDPAEPSATGSPSEDPAIRDSQDVLDTTGSSAKGNSLTEDTLAPHNKKKEGKNKKSKDFKALYEELHSGVEDTDLPDIERVDVPVGKKEKKAKHKEKKKK